MERAIFASTSELVHRNTTPAATDRIRAKTRASLEYYEEHPDEIPLRLRELDREWDIERMLETGSSSLTLAGLALGLTVNRKWFLLSAAVQGFFLQHAVQGWCPPLPVLRRMGVRTSQEIESERCALLALELGRVAREQLELERMSTDSRMQTESPEPSE